MKITPDEQVKNVIHSAIAASNPCTFTEIQMEVFTQWGVITPDELRRLLNEMSAANEISHNVDDGFEFWDFAE